MKYKVKKHILSMILYIVGFLAGLVLLLLLEQPFLIAFLAILALLPCIFLPLFFLSYKKLVFKAYCICSGVEKGNAIPIRFKMENPTFSPFFLCDITFTVNNLYFPNELTHFLSIHVSPKSNDEVKVPIDTAHVGIVRLSVSEVRVSDLLHFFSVTLPFTPKLEVPVFPEERMKEDLPATPASDGLDEYTESDSKGNISSDIKEIREYQPGDRLQRIHWKLSAKLDDLFVKEMAHTSVLSLVLLPELYRDNIEETVSTLLGSIKILQQREERFEVCLYNHAAVDFSFLTAFDEASKTEAIIRLYYLPLYDEKNLAKDAFFASGVKKATVIQIIGDEVIVHPME
ncbi:MAG: DUF58 domain-containing protein [Lachnospiraceae bacterium]|nr:DUF58 domain-containing protein [Lachnospiraceae bacterium]